jgi:dihydrodipicolinate synthase/N-acetylneuraminate lyase
MVESTWLRAKGTSVISGVCVPLLTAFASDGAVAPGAYARQAEWLASRGVDGLVPFGSTGEGPSLSLREKRVLLEALAPAVPGLPLVPAVTDPSLDGALQLVEVINDIDATAIMLLPPFYFRQAGADGLRRFAEPVLAASRHPVIFYHIPEFAPPVPPDLVASMPVWGVKDSGGDLAYTRAVLATGKQVMVGVESTVVEAVTAGARGTIAGLANILPEPVLAACAAAADGRPEDGHQVLAPALAFRDELLAAGRPVAWVSMMKRLAEERHGIPLGGVRAPLPDAGAGGLLPSLRELLSVLELTTT